MMPLDLNNEWLNLILEINSNLMHDYLPSRDLSTKLDGQSF
jgi:hypothetical protein